MNTRLSTSYSIPKRSPVNPEQDFSQYTAEKRLAGTRGAYEVTTAIPRLELLTKIFPTLDLDELEVVVLYLCTYVRGEDKYHVIIKAVLDSMRAALAKHIMDSGGAEAIIQTRLGVLFDEAPGHEPPQNNEFLFDQVQKSKDLEGLVSKFSEFFLKYGGIW